MYRSKFGKTIRNAAVALTLAGSSALVSATPYSITYTGTIGNSVFPEVNSGESYTATLVFDNGGASTASQSWDASDLTCAIWTANNAGDVVIATDMTAQTNLDVSGTVSTDGAGSLTSNFTEVAADPVNAGTFSASGIALVEAIDWYMNDGNRVFYSDSQANSWGDAAGGVQMAVGNWSNPAIYTGNCQGAVPPAPAATQIPVMPLWLLALMGGLLSWIGVRKLRQA